MYCKKNNKRNGFYDTGDGHQLYWERHGAIGADPLFFLHGGPGGYCNTEQLVFFDLERFDVILFDQRGCGQSQGGIERNNTALLVQDIEALRRYFGFTTISLLGVSWGSWLALLFQKMFPLSVAQLTIASLFIPCKENLLAYEKQLWHCLHAVCQQSSMSSFNDIWIALRSDCPELQRSAAKLWLSVILLMTGKQVNTSWMDRFVDEHTIRALTIELHYHRHGYFCCQEDMGIGLSELQSLVILQGTDDFFGMRSLCWLRERGFVKSRLFPVGHDIFHPLLQQSIREAVSR